MQMDRVHDLRVASPRRVRAEATSDGPSSIPVGRRTPVERSKGLCMNCDHRFTCSYPVPEGGVWQCEEYE